jgi:hypothetical protein
MVALLVVPAPRPVSGWGNGGNGGDGYATHDWVVDQALDILDAAGRRPAWFDRRKRNSNEFYVYRVRAILAKVHRNLDRDYHLELRDPDDPSARLVAEIPSPACARATAGYSELAASRLTARALRARRGGALVEVVGVGFFDRLHKARGAAGNRFELHPVLEITEIQDPMESQAAP